MRRDERVSRARRVPARASDAVRARRIASASHSFITRAVAAHAREAPRGVERGAAHVHVRVRRVARARRARVRTDGRESRAQDESSAGVGALVLRRLTRACASEGARGRGVSRAVVLGAWTRPGGWFVGDVEGDARAVDARDAAADARDERPLREAMMRAVEEASARVGVTSASEDGRMGGGGRRGGVLAWTRASGTTACALDCASKVERTFGAGALVRLVRSLRRDERVSVVFTLAVGAERGEGERAIEAEASCAVVCRDVAGDATATMADIDVDVRRAGGRRKRERERVTIRGDDELEFAPIEVESVERAVARALRVAGDAGVEEDDESRAARRLQSSVPFDLGVSLTAEEREARRNVRLSYEHQGVEGVAAYAAGDFLAYLPRDAGGRGDAINRLRPARGHIYYEPDDVDRELDDDDLFPDTDDDADDF